MRHRQSTFAVRFTVFALCALMVASANVSMVLASPQAAQEVPPNVGFYGEQANPCDPASGAYSVVSTGISGVVAVLNPIAGVIVGVGTTAAGYYLNMGCEAKVAEAYAKVHRAFYDAYKEADGKHPGPGYPVGFVHQWANIIIQDFSGGFDNSGTIRRDEWGAIIWGGGDSNELPHYIGGTFWSAYKSAVNDPNVVGTSLYPGYPINIEHVWPGSTIRIQDFRGGSWGDAAIIGTDEEAWLVAGRHWEAYWQHNGQIDLRNPLGPLYIDDDGWYTQDFEGGRIRELGGEIKVEPNNESAGGGEVPDVAASEPEVAVAPAPAAQNPGGAAAFHLPWEQGSVWRITVGNGEGEHSNAANYHGFDAVAVPGRSTTNVTAVADGTVMDFQESMPDTALVNSGHAGNCVILDHGGGVYSMYAHLAQDSVPLSKGQHITSGTVIGTMGNSGFSTGPHLHWAVLNSAWMYSDPNVSPYQTCSGRTIESRYVDPDKELQEDGGIPRTGRYYESFNSFSGTSVEPANVETSMATETTESPQVIAPIEEPVVAQTPIDPAAMEPSGSGSSDIAIVTTENGQPVYDACYVIVDYSEVGCDENGDGKITFEDIPLGPWTVRQTADLGPGRSVPDFTIQVTGAASDDGWERFPATLTSTGESASDSSPSTASTSGSSASASAGQETWSASAQVNLCDAPPGSGSAMNCQAGAGVTVDISLASGEWLGSCTTGEPVATPWDTFISLCTVEGMPFNADIVATQDPATIPPGYVPSEETLTLHVDDLIPGGGDQATFTFFNVPGGTGASTSGPSGPAAPAGAVDPMALLPSVADVPGGLVETGRRTRTLPEVVANYTDPFETTRLFTGWGWQGNAVASFALPSGQPAQSGQVNGVYVSIHQFSDAGAAREALDFSISEQAAGTALQEISTRPVGEYTRVLYGPMDYGNETTVLVQQGSFFIRVSAAMLDGDPTADALAVTEAILLKMGSISTIGATAEPASATSPIDYFYVGCIPAKACLNATITLTTQDGEFIASGTCPDTDMIAPWTCGLRDVPRGIPVVITIDGIVPGYAVEQNPLYWDTTKVPSPGPSEGPDGMPRFTFVQTDGGASSTTLESATTTGSSSSSGTGSLTVYFFSPRDNMRQTVGDCVELVGATKALCSEDYPDGQIEIVNIPAGTYEVCVTHGAPHFFWGRSHGPKSVTISPGSHETIQLDVYLKWSIDAGRQCGFD